MSDRGAGELVLLLCVGMMTDTSGRIPTGVWIGEFCFEVMKLDHGHEAAATGVKSVRDESKKQVY